MEDSYSDLIVSQIEANRFMKSKAFSLADIEFCITYQHSIAPPTFNIGIACSLYDDFYEY